VSRFLREEKNMPRRKSSVKRTRADRKKHLRNLRIKRQLKETLKKFQELISAKKAAEAKALIPRAFKELDKAAKKRIIHAQTANRTKSRLSLRLLKIT
jgi:small subunit ribosomal protein S20